MVRQLFGTDGVRGVASEFPLDPKTVHALGAALADVAARVAPCPEVAIGMDTRESSPWLAGQVAGGLAEHGARVRFAGVTTTPGVAYLTRTGTFVAGVMISASHNPYRDNGIKIFSHSGYKLPDDQEHAIEQEIFALLEAGVEPAPAKLAPDPGLDRHYMEYLAPPDARLRAWKWSSIAATVRPPGWPRSCLSASALESLRYLRRPTAAISTWVAVRWMSENCVKRFWPAPRRWVSLSTATPTAQYLSPARARSSTATPCCCSPRRRCIARAASPDRMATLRSLPP